MRNTPREFYGMRHGKFLEAALLGRPGKFESKLPILKAFKNGKLVPLLKKNLDIFMQEVRDNQTDDPTWPERPFNKRFLNDVENGLATIEDLPASYEVRVYSAVETALDAAGVDFWIELYDDEERRVLTSYKIDLKSNPHGHMGRMADQVFYYDEKTESLQDAFETTGYKDLVKNTVRHFNSHIQRSKVVQHSRGNLYGQRQMHI